VAVTIRLSRHGRHKVALYRIVAADENMKRDGRYLELLGTYNPNTNPPDVKLKEERVKYWVGVGAKTSDTMSQIIEKQYPGFITGLVAARRKKLQAARKKRKTNTTAKAPRRAAKKARTEKVTVRKTARKVIRKSTKAAKAAKAAEKTA